jgi:hypothetical protein
MLTETDEDEIFESMRNQLGKMKFGEIPWKKDKHGEKEER